MTAVEIFLEKYNNHEEKAILEQSIATALLDPESLDEDVERLFSFYGYSRYINEQTLKQCINFYASEKRLETLSRAICDFISTHRSVISKDLNNFVIELVTSEDGYKRMLGRLVWDELEMEHSDIDILEYNEDVQSKFAISILQDMLFPKDRLPKLLPLFNSPYETVRQCLFYSLAHYTLNYYGTVTKMFEQGHYEESQELTAYKNYLYECELRFDLYHKCKELHSYYCLPEEYEIAQRAAAEHMRELTKSTKTESLPSILNMCSNVVLGRGGGFRDENGGVQPLGHISYSQELPMMFYGQSPYELREYNNNVLFKNWQDCITKHETKDC